MHQKDWFRSVLDLRPQRPGSIHAKSSSVAVDCAEATRWSCPFAAAVLNDAESWWHAVAAREPRIGREEHTYCFGSGEDQLPTLSVTCDGRPAYDTAHPFI